MSELHKEISELLNEHSKENESNTLDFILAEYLMGCLEVFETVIKPRFKSYEQRISSANKGTEQFIADRRGVRRQAQIEQKAPERRQTMDRRNLPDW